MKSDDQRADISRVECQLHDLSEAGVRLSGQSRVALRCRQLKRYFVRNAFRVITNPSILWRKLRELLGWPIREIGSGEETRCFANVERLGLKPGERVRVKPLTAILATLNDDYRFQGMAFMPDEMAPFCGGVYTVRKCVDRFFDERNQRLLRLRNVVILEGVYCEPRPDSPTSYAGCARTCYLFWKEAWLERVTSECGAGE